MVNKNRVNIAIIEPSDIIYEGLSNILLQESRSQYRLFHFDSLEDISNEIDNNQIELLIINPSLVKNDVKNFQRIKSNEQNMLYIGIIYSFFEKETLAHFDALIEITDTPQSITDTINRLISANQTETKTPHKEQLSLRETEVLQELAKGLSNKEIADQLNISTHTVISHRKNIIQKTGIRSQAGLAIYAISNKIINIEDFQDIL